ncbi:MAG TPA: hypothetical protein V6C57_14135 [Coleofasciculaceae cyanobacterium]
MNIIDLIYSGLRPGKAIDHVKSQRYIMSEQQRLIAMQQRLSKLATETQQNDVDRLSGEFERFF